MLIWKFTIDSFVRAAILRDEPVPEDVALVFSEVVGSQDAYRMLVSPVLARATGHDADGCRHCYRLDLWSRVETKTDGLVPIPYEIMVTPSLWPNISVSWRVSPSNCHSVIASSRLCAGGTAPWWRSSDVLNRFKETIRMTDPSILGDMGSLSKTETAHLPSPAD